MERLTGGDETLQREELTRERHFNLQLFGFELSMPYKMSLRANKATFTFPECAKQFN